MGFFDWFSRKKDKDKSEEVRHMERDKGHFTGFVLLSEERFDKAKFFSDLKKDWGIELDEGEVSEENKEAADNMVYGEVGDFRLVVGVMPAPIPNGEAEHFAKANYMWKNAVEETSKHKAHIIVTVLGGNDNVFEKGRLFVKAAAALLKQDNAIALYSEGAVYEAKMYIDCAEILKTSEIPILNWVWFGIYGNDEKTGFYTYGMKRFGKDEIEIYADAETAKLEEIRGLILNIAVYVLDKNVSLKDGDTIGISEEQKLKITITPGIAVPGNTIKIAL